METQVVKLENRQTLKKKELDSQISLESDKRKLVELKTKNQKKQADAHQYILSAGLKPYQSMDWKTLLAIHSKGLNPADNLALAFRELAENAEKIGNLNISPDLLDSILQTKS